MCVNVCERRLSVDFDAECDQYLQYSFGHRNRFVLPFSLTMDAHAFNAPPARRMIGYQCTNPHCGVFADDQHRNHWHATRAGTLCASIMMREELTAVRRADRSSAVLSARPRQGNERDANKVRCAQADELVALPTCLPETSVEIQTILALIEEML
jgi:hypothetical protein